MKIIYGLNKIKKFNKAVVALGVFDGVHLGHRRILKETVRRACRIKGVSVALTFYPHPRKEQSLYSLKHRLNLIAELGIDACIVIKFNRSFSGISAVNFIKDILVAKIGAKFIYVGKNFKFGKFRIGDYKLLDKLSGLYNYKLKAFNMIRFNRRPISSTYIRRLITEGKLNIARKLLQRPVAVFGTVIRGISLAKKLGFPTANIDPHHEILPPSGVYLVKVIFKNKIFYGACNIGKKPTLLTVPEELGAGPQKQIEVYIFDFNKNIYGLDLEVQFIRKLRNEKKFSSLELLAIQIKKDIHQAQKMVSRL